MTFVCTDRESVEGAQKSHTSTTSTKEQHFQCIVETCLQNWEQMVSIEIDMNSKEFESNSELKFNLKKFSSELNILRHCLKKFWIKNQLLNKRCEKIGAKVNQLQTKCNITKTVGVSFGGMGSIAMVTGVILIPFTAGLSAIFGIIG